MRCVTPEECVQWRAEFSNRRRWKCQVTCATPKSLRGFTANLVELLSPFNQAFLAVDQVVFEMPTERQAYRRVAGETRSLREAPGHLFGAGEGEELRTALEILLGEWIDLHIILSPARHALVADHDEYTTFFSESPGKIAEVRDAWKRAGIEPLDYIAEPP